MREDDLTAEELARLLREAAQAHRQYETELGRRDEDWPGWYAEFIMNRLRERSGGGDDVAA